MAYAVHEKRTCFETSAQNQILLHMAKCHLGKIKLKTMLASGLMHEPMVPRGFARAQYLLQVSC